MDNVRYIMNNDDYAMKNVGYIMKNERRIRFFQKLNNKK